MKNWRRIIGYLCLVVIAISMLYPFFAMINLSFVPNGEIFNQGGGKLLYSPLTVNNYSSVFEKIPLWKYFINSLFVAVLTTIGQVIISALAGYAFARMTFKYRDALFLLILITMLVPPQVNIIPLFFLMRQFHWINTYQALILPGLFGGFGIFLMRQYFLGLPKDLEESAKIDGCNIFTTFFKIALPLATPAIATLAIFTFVSSWNSFMWPLIVTNTESMRTLPVGLAIFKGSFREITLWGDLLACSVICTIPVVGVFLLGKKYFINDILQGGVKE
ncbi:carbohydrate ABC transporter permease [bacterium]|nr:carbohydrate ABC transporter permease [bacterium]